MAKLVKFFIIFGPVRGTIKVIKKYANRGQTIDESLMSTLCLPRIEITDQRCEPRFQTFLVTKEDGLVLYGSGLIVQERLNHPPSHSDAGRYANFCYTILTDTPFINATRSLLHLIWEKKCDDTIVRAIMNIPLPPRRKCLRIVPPQQKSIDDIYLYRGMADLPLLDYPIRELFGFLQIDDFLLAFACILMEMRTLIISQDNYKLMMVGETLTSLLSPLKWCNVYVPILPPVYGATYLDAPTSYIMGVNTQVTELPDNLQHVQCRIYCDDSKVVCDVDTGCSLAFPLFLNEIKNDIMNIRQEFLTKHLNKPYTYLDDLKFNRAIRVMFIKTIRKNILANYERYIVDVPETSSDVRQFDTVSYLSDKPDFMYSFLSKFLDTQLFASFIDENAKRMQQSWLSIFDMDPDELSDHFSDKSLEQAFQSATRIHLTDLREEHPNIEVKTVPASPMKLNRRVPALAVSWRNRLNFAASKSSSNSSTIDHGTGSVPPEIIDSSPPVHRNSIAPISLKPSVGLGTTLPNGKIAELISEVRDLTKSIMIENMGTSPSKIVPTRHRNNSLIGALCDLIERVWAHGSYGTCCPLWTHLVAFSRLKYLDSRPKKQEFADGSNLNVLLPENENTELDQTWLKESKLFSWFKAQKIGPLARDLINDMRTIHMLADVKTEIGKARAFIRLSLERKKLSKHLKTLLEDQGLLCSLYKPYAFLRCEEEREQFLMYLLTLNAVDLNCYSTSFVSVIDLRRERIKPTNQV